MFPQEGAILAVAWTMGVLVAASGVVEVGAGTEARVTHNAAEDDGGGPGSQVGTIVLAPLVRAALDAETRSVAASYAPELSVIARDEPAALLVHNARLAGELALGRRTQLRCAATGNLGDLDPSGVVLALRRTSGSAAPGTILPYAAGQAALAGVLRLSRRTELSVAAQASGSRSPGEATIPATGNGAVDTTLQFKVGRLDSALVGVRAISGAMDGRGNFGGGAAVLGWQRELVRGASLSVWGGVGPLFVDETQQEPRNAPPIRTTLLLPVGQARAQGLFTLGPGIVGGVLGGVDLGALADPTGALLEERLAVTGGLVAQLRRVWTLRTDVTGFGPLLAIGLPADPIATTSWSVSGSLSWAVTRQVVLEAGVLGTSRLLDSRLASDATVRVALIAIAPVLHAGTRRDEARRQSDPMLDQPNLLAPSQHDDDERRPPQAELNAESVESVPEQVPVPEPESDTEPRPSDQTPTHDRRPHGTRRAPAEPNARVNETGEGSDPTSRSAMDVDGEGRTEDAGGEKKEDDEDKRPRASGEQGSDSTTPAPVAPSRRILDEP